MVLVGPHEDHRPAPFQAGLQGFEIGLRQLIAQKLLEEIPAGRRHGDAEDLLELVHGRRCACAHRHELVPGPGVDQLLDERLGPAQPLRGDAARCIILGMRVAVQLQR